MVSSIFTSWMSSVPPIPFRSYLSSSVTSIQSLEVLENQAEISGGPLRNRNSVYLHLEQGLAIDATKPAIISTDQPEHHLDDIIAISDFDHKFDHVQTKHDKRFKSVNGMTNGDINHTECLKLSYKQVQHVALNLAAGLSAYGVKPGSTILMLVPNGAEYGLLLWMSVVMRITYVCADPSVLSASGIDELRHMLQMVKPAVIAVADGTTAKYVDALVSVLKLAQPVRICTSKSDTSLGWSSLLDVASKGSTSTIDKELLLEDARDDDPQRVHSILFTSGTSGRPKGCPLRVGGQAHVLKSQAWLIDKEAAALVLQQAHPSRGISAAQTLQTWRAGGAVVTTGKGFAADDVARAIREHRVTFVVFTPAMVHDMGKIIDAGSFNVDSVRRIQIGGDAVTKGILMRCAVLFPSAQICVNHGMTEGGGTFIWPFFQTSISKVPYFGEICPVGMVAPGATVRLWDSDERKLCQRGKPGELHIRCGSVIKHYMFGESEDSFYEDETGRWFKNGDIAIMNGDGLVFILGRTKDVIKCAGTTIMPAPLESCIEEYLAEATVVVSVPHRQLGHQPLAVVSALKRKTPEEVKEHVRRTFGKQNALGGLITLQQLGLEEFPVNATHKIRKQDVQAAVLQYLNNCKISRQNRVEQGTR